MKRLFDFLAGLWFSIVPTPRLAAYVGLGGILFLTGVYAPGLRIIAFVYDLALLGAALLDVGFSARPRDFEVGREFDDKMNLGVPNEVKLWAKNRTQFSTTLTLRDEVPESFSITNDEPPRFQDNVQLPPLPRAILKIEPSREVSGSYKLTPNRRGDFQFGDLSVRYPTVLGLWFRQFRAPLEHNSARVYPDTTAVRRYELALREGKLRDIGLHILRLRGRGTEFESLREYTGDDEFKNINWKASARRGKLISTDYEIERDQTILICLDCGRMATSLAVSRERALSKKSEDDETDEAFSSESLARTPLSKLDCAINATVLLAHIAASMGDNVGLMLFSDQVLKYLPPRKGRVQTGAIIEALYAAQPSLVEPDYQSAYETILSRKLRRSLIVTFTDIIDPEASRELLQASAALRRHHNALCVTINNRDVMDMAAQMPQIASDFYDKAMAQKMLSERQSALEALRGCGVGILDVDAADLSVAAVNRYLELKSRGVM